MTGRICSGVQKLYACNKLVFKIGNPRIFGKRIHFKTEITQFQSSVRTMSNRVNVTPFTAPL
jgi:hypothetical protein